MRLGKKKTWTQGFCAKPRNIYVDVGLSFSFDFLLKFLLWPFGYGRTKDSQPLLGDYWEFAQKFHVSDI